MIEKINTFSRTDELMRICRSAIRKAVARNRCRMKITYAAAISEDGFIAREDGDVKWLEECEIDHEQTGLAELLADVDGLVMGRATYDFVFNYGAWPYGDKPTWVCTSRELSGLDGASIMVATDPEDVSREATERGFRHLWLLGGGVLASAFLDAGLITDLSLHRMPVCLGSGIPLFADHQLEDLPTKTSTVTQKTGFEHVEIGS